MTARCSQIVRIFRRLEIESRDVKEWQVRVEISDIRRNVALHVRSTWQLASAVEADGTGKQLAAVQQSICWLGVFPVINARRLRHTG